MANEFIRKSALNGERNVAIKYKLQEVIGRNAVYKIRGLERTDVRDSFNDQEMRVMKYEKD